MNRAQLMAAALLAGGSLGVCDAAAQDQTGPARADADGSDEIVVTATRRAERAQDVAMQISAFSGDDLADAGVKTGRDIVRLTPGMSFTAPSGDAGAIVFNMRGVGLNDFGVGNESPVAIYADDAYVASLSAAAAPTFDLERVEVVRGPQGTLFGRNATGGLVHFLSARPGRELGGYLDVRAGEGYALEGALNAPVTDAAALRLSLASEHVDPWIDNTLGDGGNGVDRTAGRLQMLVEGASTSVLLNLHGGVTRSHPQFTFQATDPGPDGLGVAGDTPANLIFGVPATSDFAALLDDDPYSGAVNTAGRNKRTAYGATLRFDWSAGDIDVTAISNAERGETDYLEDSDMTPVQAFEIPSFSRAIQYAQELRAAYEGERASWVAGLYYFHNHVINPRRFDLYSLGVSYDSRMEQTAESAAVFGELTYKLTESVTLVGGLRYTTETRETDFNQVLRIDTTGDGFPAASNDIVPVFAFGPTTVGARAERTDDNVSGRVRLEWRPDNNLLWYVAFNRGFKSGGFNNPLTADNFTPELMPYEPETLDSAELGLKSDLLDGRLRINANLFYYDYKDFQSFRTDGLNNFLSNVDATISGINIDFTLRPTDRLTLAGGIEALDARAGDITLPSLRRTERTLANAPEFSAVASVSYEQPVGAGILGVELSARYVGEQFYDISNAPVTREGAYTVADARLSFSLQEGGPEFFIAGNNILDEVYRLYVIDVNSLGFSQAMYGRPRSVAAGVRFDF